MSGGVCNSTDSRINHMRFFIRPRRFGKSLFISMLNIIMI
ncbi:AAA family ATPase [Clostridium estertheticum]|nr:AAA family ATPase [Clostridium estertheticum]